MNKQILTNLIKIAKYKVYQSTLLKAVGKITCLQQSELGKLGKNCKFVALEI